MVFSWHHIKGIYYQHAMRVDVNLDHLAEVLFFRILYYKITLSHMLFTLYFLWKEVTMHITHLKSEELCFPTLNGEYLQKWFVILPHGRCIYSLPFIYLSSHFFTLVWTHEYTLYTLGLTFLFITTRYRYLLNIFIYNLICSSLNLLIW